MNKDIDAEKGADAYATVNIVEQVSWALWCERNGAMGDEFSEVIRQRQERSSTPNWFVKSEDGEE